MDELSNHKFCKDYFIPVSNLRNLDPGSLEKNVKQKLIEKGIKRILNGEVCLLINAAGMGENTQYYRSSRIWNLIHEKLNVSHL